MVVATGLLVGGLANASAAGAEASTESAPASIAPTGMGAATPRTVDVRTAAAGPQIPASPRSFGPLGADGRPATASLPAQSPSGTKPAPAVAPPAAGGPNLGGRVQRPPGVAPLAAPTTINANFNGINQATSNCGGCQPPDPNAAVSPSEIAHTANLRLQVYTKAGATLCGVGLNTFIGTSASLSDPRILWDNRNNRYLLVVIPVPASTTSTPTLFLAASTGTSACGSWFIYTLTFSGSLYPAGTLLDYPYLGQDRVAALLSSNNFRRTTSGFVPIGSAAFSVSKARLYVGASVSFPAFSVGFSTAPVTVSGIPIASTTNSYYLRSIPGTGYGLYRMSNSAGPGTTLVLQATISSPFARPSRRVRQPGTSATLDPLDGRIVWAPVQDENFVWFTHGMDLSGYPAVRYGAVSVVSNTATVAKAFRSSTSDDFNPSIGVADAGANAVFVWLNWAYTDTPANVATSVTVDGVRPGTGVPDLIGTGRVLVNGFSTVSNFRFGDYSSVAVDPTAASGTCPAGRTAVTAQQYFTSNGQWRVRLSRLSFC